MVSAHKVEFRNTQSVHNGTTSVPCGCAPWGHRAGRVRGRWLCRGTARSLVAVPARGDARGWAAYDGARRPFFYAHFVRDRVPRRPSRVALFPVRYRCVVCGRRPRECCDGRGGGAGPRSHMACDARGIHGHARIQDGVRRRRGYGGASAEHTEGTVLRPCGRYATRCRS